MDIEKLTLKISPRAKERMLQLGGEFYISTRDIFVPNAPNKKVTLSVANIGHPPSGSYTKVEEDGVTVWASDDDTFIRNEMVIDLYAIGYMVLPICLSTIIIQNCEGSCDSCGLECTSREEN